MLPEKRSPSLGMTDRRQVLNMSYLKNPSIALATGYLVGQGSVFGFQLIAKAYDATEFLGLTVLFVSLASFALQFSDFGNTTYVVRKVMAGKNSESAFLTSRSFLAFWSCAFIAIATYQSGQDASLDLLLVALPLLGMLSGLQVFGVLEARNQYWRMTLLQSIPWATMSVTFSILLWTKQSLLTFAPIALLVACLLVYSAGKRIARYERGAQSAVRPNFKALFSALPFVTGPIGGQVWGRVVILAISSQLGLSALGDFGIVRNTQVALILLLGFLGRPILRSFVAKYVASGSRTASLRELLYLYRKLLGLSVIVPVLVVISEVGEFAIPHLSNWLWLLIAIPISLTQVALVQCNQIDYTKRQLILFDNLALMANIGTFVLLKPVGLVFSVVGGETMQCLVGIGIRLSIKGQR